MSLNRVERVFLLKQGLEGRNLRAEPKGLPCIGKGIPYPFTLEVWMGVDTGECLAGQFV